MKLIVNDKLVEMADGSDFGTLLKTVGATPGKVAVMINGEIVPRAEHQTVRLKERDRIELLTFAGGG